MKSHSQLVRNLRRFFGAFRILFGAILLLVSPLLIFSPDSRLLLSTPTIYLNAPSVSFKTTPDGTKRVGILNDLRGQIDIVGVSKTDRSTLVLIALTGFWLHGGFGVLFFHLLWRLCRNVENGQVFAEPNLTCVRRMGVALIGYTLASFIVGVWVNSFWTVYAREHIVIEGFTVIEPRLSAIMSGIDLEGVSFDFGGLTMGFVVLALADVFRHGLRLQEETTLTV
jgi:hypothetical protein